MSWEGNSIMDAFIVDLIGAMPRLRRYAIGLCHRPDFADDLVQETVRRALAGRSGFDGMNMGGWLTTICHNYYVHQWRKNKSQEIYIAAVPVPVTEPEHGYHARDQIQRLFSGLEERYHPLLEKLMTGGDSYQELAVALGIPVGTVKSKVSRLRERARQILGEG